MTYYKLRNDMSVATLSRIIAAAHELGKNTFVCDIQVMGALDVRLRLFPPRSVEAYKSLAEDISTHCAGQLPRGALKIVEEDP